MLTMGTSCVRGVVIITELEVEASGGFTTPSETTTTEPSQNLDNRKTASNGVKIEHDRKLNDYLPVHFY